MILKVERGVSFMGDRERIHQMMVILLDNAMKYTNEGGRFKSIARKRVVQFVYR